MAEVLHAAVDEVCKYEPENEGVDLLRKALQKVYSRTLGDRDYGIFEVVHLGLRLPLMFTMLEPVTLNTLGSRVMRRDALTEPSANAPLFYPSKVDKFDQRLELLNGRWKKSSVGPEELRNLSFYEFTWKFHESRAALVRSANPRCIRVTPSMSADSASVVHPRHIDYARSMVVAHWRMMTTADRFAMLRARLPDSDDMLAANPGRTLLVGSTDFPRQVNRFLGVQDLVRKFDNGRKDAEGRPVGWALALLEMLVDPILSEWVPSWVLDQYDRWNKLNKCLDAILEPKSKQGGSLVQVVPTKNHRLLLQLYNTLVKRAKAKAEKEAGERQALATHNAGSDGDSCCSLASAGAKTDSEPSGDERQPVEIEREARPTAGDVEAGELDDDWAHASADQRLSAAPAAPAAPDVNAAASRGSGGEEVVNPPGYDWRSVVSLENVGRLGQVWRDLRQSGIQSNVDGVPRGELDEWGKFAYDIVKSSAGERRSLPSQRARGVSKALRLFLTGGAGAGKTRTIRALVRLRQELAAADGTQEHLRDRVCVLSTPTGTASFQIKNGATTAHRNWSVPIGYCGPLSRQGAAYKKLRERVRYALLAIFDEVSMIGIVFMGKVLYRAQEVAEPCGAQETLAGIDVILSGHLAQAPPIGDEPIYKTGAYTGKALNKPPTGDSGPGAKSHADFVAMSQLFLQEFEDVAMLLRTHRVDDTGDVNWTRERRAQYKADADRFLEVTSRMADLEWTRDDHAWLAKRNLSSLLTTHLGRETVHREFEDAILLMDTRKTTSTGQDGADRYNDDRLRKLSRESGQPILAIRATHAKPKGVDAAKMDAEDFKGLPSTLSLCVSARVLLTQNLCVEAGLVNGGAGYVRGFVFPRAFDPNSEDSKKAVPLCIVVEFDDVSLGCLSSGAARTFFPGDPNKARWVPIMSSGPVASEHDSEITRDQFPLTLAWALTHWKAQGMTLRRVRVCLRERTAGAPGVGYVAITRVKHPEHLLFEYDLPEWEVFQQARSKPAFRQRRRMELRLAARFSRTIRKYGFCTADGEQWSAAERRAASELLLILRVQGNLQAASRAVALGLAALGDDAWVWAVDGPDINQEMRKAVDSATRAQTPELTAELLEAVGLRLLSGSGPDRKHLHLPAVQEALRCLIPAWLDPVTDNHKLKSAGKAAGDSVGVYLNAKAWRVDVSAESMLRSGRPVRKEVLEFFLILLKQVCSVLGLSIAIGTTALGTRLGSGEELDLLLRRIQSWTQWGSDEKQRMRDASEFLVPVCEDSQGKSRQHDWVLARVVPGDGAATLGAASSLRVFVADRFSRNSVKARIAERLGAVAAGMRRGQAGFTVCSEVDFCPSCDNALDANLLVFGLLTSRVAAAAGVQSMDPKSYTYVQDVRAAMAEAFSSLRAHADGHGNRDVSTYLSTPEHSRKLLNLLASQPPLREQAPSSSTRRAPGRTAVVTDKAGDALNAFCLMTWNVNQVLQPSSAMSPANDKLWSDADNLAAVEADVLRLKPDVVTLQEVHGDSCLIRLAKNYNLIGARPGANRSAGFLHLYARKGLVAEQVDAPSGLHGVLAKVQFADTQFGIVALHLQAGAQGSLERRAGFKLAVSAVAPVASTIVVCGDLNLREEEVKLWKLCQSYSLEEVAYEGSSWNPRANRYDPDFKDAQPMRFDRMFFRGAVFASGFLAGKRKQFQAGFEFFLSDHFALLALVDVHTDYGARDASRHALHARRAALTRLRDQNALREAVEAQESLRVGREHAAVDKRKGREAEMEDVQKRQHKARNEREKRFKALYDAAFGAGSLRSRRHDASAPVVAFGVQVSDGRGGVLVCQNGTADDFWRALRSSGNLAGMHGFSNRDQESCFANSILQVLFRSAPVVSWLAEHTAECTAAAGECLACLVAGSALDLRHPPSQPRLVAEVRKGRFLPAFERGQHDAAEFLQQLLDLLVAGELTSGRIGSWSSGAGIQFATHVDRLFAGVVATLLQCAACSGPVRSRFEKSYSLLLPTPLADDVNRTFTATELSFMFAAEEHIKGDEMLNCDACGCNTEHSRQLVLVTAPTLLLLQPRRSVFNSGRLQVLRHKVVPELSIALTDAGNFDLAAVVYHRGSSPLSGHYFAVAKAHDNRWWKFDDSVVTCFNEDVERYSLSFTHLLVYTRPRGLASFSDGVRAEGLSAPSAGSDFKAAADGISLLSPMEWKLHVRAYLNSRRSDVHVTSGFAVADVVAVELRGALVDGRGSDVERILRDLVIASRGEVGAGALANYDWRSFAVAFLVYLRGSARCGAASGVVSVAPAVLVASEPLEALPREASHILGARIAAKRGAEPFVNQTPYTSNVLSNEVVHEQPHRESAVGDPILPPGASRLKRSRRSS